MNRAILLIGTFGLLATGFAQSSKIEKAMRNAMTFQNMSLVYENGEGTKFHCLYQVRGCSFDKEAVRTFPASHPEYKIVDMDVENTYKWGYYEETVVAFTFYRTDAASNSLEVAVQLANKNNGLHISYTNASEAYTFYQNYVREYPELAEIFKKQFATEFPNYVKNNPDGMKRFCDASPYYNNELLKDINVWNLLQDSKKSQAPYVFLLESNRGYIFTGNSSYTGGIRNGQAEGSGTLTNAEGSWNGTFKNGKMNGSFKNTKSIGTFSAHQWSFTGDFKVVCQGNCVNDRWDGEVVKEVTCLGRAQRYGYGYTTCSCSDVEKLYYSNGSLQRSVSVSDCLSRSLDSWIERENAEHNAYVQSQKEKEQQMSSINENNIMNYVRSMETEEYAGDTYYYVYYKESDGMKGTIRYTSSGYWEYCSQGHYTNSIFTEFISSRPNTMLGALVNLYKRLHNPSHR